MHSLPVRLLTFHHLEVDLDGPVELNTEDAVESDAGEVVDVDHVRTGDDFRPIVSCTDYLVQPRVAVCSGT